MLTFKHYRDDINGGISAGALAFPLAIAFGAAAFTGLGTEYIPIGALAGIYGAIFSSLFSSIFGSTPTQIKGPTNSMAIVASTTFAMLLQYPIINQLPGNDKFPFLIFIFALVVILGGTFQIIFGIFRFGKIVKYIPYPVVAGFMNGIAIIIFIKQIKPFLGFSIQDDYLSIFTQFSKTNFLICLVGIITILGIKFIPKYFKKIPPSLAGLLSGIISYLLIGKFIHHELLILQGNKYIIGELSAALPKPSFLINIKSFYRFVSFDLIKLTIPSALTLGILSSIDTLSTSAIVDVRTRTRHHSSKELVGLGIGNIMAGIFGGLPGAGTTERTLANIDAGGKTNLSGIIHCIFLLLVILIFSSIAKWIPMSALSGILIVFAYKAINKWSITLIRKKTVLFDVIVMILVSVITIFFNLIIAVAIGLVIACILFIKKQVQYTVIKRIFSAKTVQSKKIRAEKEIEILGINGNDIKIVELQGSLFFGNTHSFADYIEKHIKKTKYIIFDFKNIIYVDLTGAQLLLDLIQRLIQSGVIVCISGLTKFNDSTREKTILFLSEIGIFREVENNHIFYNFDFALEYCEDLLLKSLNIGFDDDKIIDLNEIELLNSLTHGEINILKRYITTKSYKKDSVIFQTGDEGNEIYFISKGEVSIIHKLTDDISNRIITYGAGANFGEMAMLDMKPRSATVIATKDCELYCLSKRDFSKLLDLNPEIGLKLLNNICIFLSRRLRSISKELKILSET